MKRLLDCKASEVQNLSSEELIEAIAKSEGRVLTSEVICSLEPLLGDISNAELAASMGADLLILNMFDVQKPEIKGLPAVDPDKRIVYLKQLIGRPVGINLEPVVEVLEQEDQLWAFTEGRRATVDNVREAQRLGVDFVVLTGNPGIGVTNEAILQTIRQIKQELTQEMLIVAGKMHASGIAYESGEKLITPQLVESFCRAGADIILVPAPGTVPGITLAYVKQLVEVAHTYKKLLMTAIGTSQEGATIDTIREIALMSKMAGADLHHIGDTGYPGIALPENIMEYSKTIRGVRHTYRRMASSVLR